MAERIAEIIVLAEDLNQGNFARRYLIRAGQHPRTIVLRLAPSGKGSAEQYVRQKYPTEVKSYRRRSSVRRAGLVVAIDADVGTVADRDAELHAELVRTGESGRAQLEAIVLLIPKRNIETWILCLLNESVDEIADYKGRGSLHKESKRAAEALFDWSRSGYTVPVHCVPSLRRALTEVRRII